MRTGASIFNELNAKTSDVPACNKKGRNDVLLKQRNDLILHRYYYWGRIKNLKMDAMERELMREVFLTPRHILAIVYAHVEELKIIYNDKPTPQQLAEKFPGFAWR